MAKKNNNPAIGRDNPLPSSSPMFGDGIKGKQIPKNATPTYKVEGGYLGGKRMLDNGVEIESSNSGSRYYREGTMITNTKTGKKGFITDKGLSDVKNDPVARRYDVTNKLKKPATKMGTMNAAYKAGGDAGLYGNFSAEDAASYKQARRDVNTKRGRMAAKKHGGSKFMK